MKKLTWVAVALMLGMGVGGCAAVPVLLGASAAGVGVYSYLEGELQRTYAVPFAKAIRVTTDVAGELKITITERSDQGITYIIKGKEPGNRPVSISIKTLAPDMTEIGVRVGVTGIWDRQSAQTIHNYIEKAL